MARARTIKPGFFTNDRLAECDPLARILFAGLWCHADRDGRLECRPKKIKAEVLPYDECDIDLLLGQLELHHFIARYSIGDALFLEVTGFGKHQNPHMKEPASIIPPSTHSDATLFRAQCEHGASTSVAGPSSLSLNPSPHSLSPPTPPREDRGGAGSPEFDEFWKRYPHKVGKPAARRAFATAMRKINNDLAAMLAGLERYIRAKPDDRAWCNPATFLNQERWLDEPARGAVDGRPRLLPNGKIAAFEPWNVSEPDAPRSAPPRPDRDALLEPS